MDGFVALWLDPDFPLEDAREIGAALTKSGGLVAGYVPPEAGLLSIEALTFAETIEKLNTIILPDRNLVTRMAAIARDGAQRPLNAPTSMAANLMAFSQCMNFNIEPSIAFHELASREGNDAARSELAWFRTADRAQAQTWVDLAVGRKDRLRYSRAPRVAKMNLAYPLGRWRRNYVASLKIAELELEEMPHLARAMTLLDWMRTEFFLAGPAAMFASVYFSPMARRRGMLKHLRSPNRARAIDGAKNAAWDITHLSDFAARLKRCEEEGCRYIFASADKSLAKIASMIVVDAEEHELEGKFEGVLSAWWPPKDAKRLSTALADGIRVAARRPPPGSSDQPDPIAGWIAEGEAQIARWQPSR